MNASASEISWEILEPALRGVLNSIVFNRQIEGIISIFLISLVVIATLLLFYKKVDSILLRSGRLKVYAILKYLKCLSLSGVILTSYTTVSSNFSDISDYKSKIEDALEVEELALEKSISLLREVQLSLSTDPYTKPKIINDSLYLDRECYTKRTGEEVINYYVVVLVNEENIDRILNNYIKNANANLNIYKTQITSDEYYELKKLE